jgi:ComF family protein
MLSLVKEYAADLFGLFYPNICLACSQKLLKSEIAICFRCQAGLPQTEHWLYADNKLVNRFRGRVELQSAAALFHFRKDGPVQHLLHQLKYRNQKEIGELIGKMFGAKLKEENSIIKNIDLIVPVPLHWKKLKLRGYNQCDPFAQGLSESMNIPWSSTALERTHENISQTKKKRFDRFGNVAEIFSVVDAEQLKDKHILLVDDVVTTGATAEACLQTILKISGTKASFASIAAASR